MTNITAKNFLDPELIAHYQQRVEIYLNQILPSPTQRPNHLHQAMRYATLNGGKRIRPLLVYATGHAFDVADKYLDIPAAAIELIHCFSLVHDDLPAIDNDDLRRGQPTCHKAFDEATAILTGDALLNHAYNIIIEQSLMPPPQILKMLHILASATGSTGMIGGEMLDILYEKKQVALSDIEEMHYLKTGKLIEASISLGATTANPNAEQMTTLVQFAQHIGLAFQLQDDILDATELTQTLGKTAGIDTVNHKANYPRTFGINATKQKKIDLYQKALCILSNLDKPTKSLEAIATLIINRNY